VGDPKANGFSRWFCAEAAAKAGPRSDGYGVPEGIPDTNRFLENCSFTWKF
jgi:hypothetical protein